jgi:dihydroneopterin aldolase
MHIHIEALTLDVIIGLLDFEREHTQRVIVDMEAEYDYTEKTFIDYATIVQKIEEDLSISRYELLEEALLGIRQTIIRIYPQIKRLKLKIAKPDIFPQCTVALSQEWIF